MSTPRAKGGAKTDAFRPRARSIAQGGGPALGASKKNRKPRESGAARRARVQRIIAGLRACYPDADCALRHRNAFELLAAVILSAQCTDERVNMVTPALFARYPDAAALAAAEQADVEALVRSTGFFRNKAKNLIGMARRLVEAFGGEVPADMDALLSLPGVARKTANCILGSWFGRNDGIVVDTHVGRLSVRLGLLSSAKDDKDAVKIERDLCDLIPQDDWTWWSHALIHHGRGVCIARKPQCQKCVLSKDCPSAVIEVSQLDSGADGSRGGADAVPRKSKAASARARL